MRISMFWGLVSIFLNKNFERLKYGFKWVINFDSYLFYPVT